ALPSEGKGRAFESRRVRQFFQWLMRLSHKPKNPPDTSLILPAPDHGPFRPHYHGCVIVSAALDSPGGD
ncbi:hypothetical protein, partial [Acidiphilium sp.]|uniref:hypothetical protein n=1 Tax=Acidiphilium sp. TaxID=527 RepID=UPI002C02F158